MKIYSVKNQLHKVKVCLFLIFVIVFSSNVFAQTATEDFDPTGDVFGGGVSGTGWVNNSWVITGSNYDTGDDYGVALYDNNALNSNRQIIVSGFVLVNSYYTYYRWNRNNNRLWILI